LEKRFEERLPPIARARSSRVTAAAIRTLYQHLKAIAGSANGGVAPGVSPKTALAVGLKVDQKTDLVEYLKSL
jgi:hypothetical protein